jgi:lysozyme
MKKSFWVSISLIFTFLFVKSIVDLTPSFGANKKISGIDISHHNNIRDWGQLKNSIDFVFIKATEGRSHKDSKFKKNWENAKNHGIHRGAYHFFSPNVSAKDQFENFKNTVTLSPGDLPPVVDVERRAGEFSKLEIDMNEVNEWLRLAEEYFGVKPIIYSDYITFKLFMDNNVNKSNLWIYVPDGYFVEPSFNNYDCLFWQHNQKGKVDGIIGKTDLDVFLGDEKDFEKLLIK